MSIMSRVAGEASQILAQKIRETEGRKIAAQAGREVAREVTGKVAKKAAGEVAAKAAGKTAAKTVAEDASKKAAATLGRDVLTKGAADVTKKTAAEVTKKTARKAAEEAANPAFEAAMAAVRDRLSKEGQYANVSTFLSRAVAEASTSEEALQVASLARKLSVRFNQANRGALLEALETSAMKAKVHEEAYATLAQVVTTRQEAYALFSLAEKRKIVETAVDRYMTVGGPSTEELATKAIKLAKARFDQRSAHSTIKRVALMETIEEQVRTIANFLNKALS